VAPPLATDDLRLPVHPLRRRLLASLLGASLSLTLFLSARHLLGPHWTSFRAGETDLSGRPRYDPPFAVSQQTFAAIDLAAVHQRLFPGWMIAHAHAGSPSANLEAERAYAELAAAVAPDANLAALLDELHRLVVSAPVAGAHRIQYLLWAWSEYLDQRGAPFWLTGHVFLRRGWPRFYTLSYRVLADRTVTVGDARHRARLLSRADETNIEELYLGQTSNEREGALVVVDRVAELASEQLWPLLAADAEPLLPDGDRPFAPLVRAEARALLPPARFEALAATAADRARLLRAVAAMRRRSRCGSDYDLPTVAIRGFSDRELAQLAALACRDRGAVCPTATDEESAAVAEASHRLRAAPDLEPAVAALVAFAARSVVTHEIRHAADAAVAGGPDRPVACPGCPPALPPAAREELSAYLTSFAAPAVAYTALLQSCAIDDGPHGAALRFARDHLLPNGCAAPPPDLPRRAAALEHALFDRAEPITLPPDFPVEIRL
jgi:hypothetical protein